LPYHVPKPAYFALVETRKFLEAWILSPACKLADKSLQDNRAYIYRNAQQELTAVVWRAVDGTREYRLPKPHGKVRQPAMCSASRSRSIKHPRCPAADPHQAAGSLFDRNAQARAPHSACRDDSYPVLADLYLAEPDSLTHYTYTSNGQTRTKFMPARSQAAAKLRETFLAGLERRIVPFQRGHGR